MKKKMKRNRRFLIVGLCAFVFVAMMFATALLAAEVGIKGTVTEEGIVAEDGQLYVVADNVVGKELMELVNKKVEVFGTVEESGGKKIITVTDFEIIE